MSTARRRLFGRTVVVTRPAAQAAGLAEALRREGARVLTIPAIRIAAPSARFHPGYTRIAVSPDLGLTLTLPRAIGYERAMRFMLEGRTVRLENFGKLIPRHQAARPGRNMQTGKPTQVPARTTVAFRPSSTLLRVLKERP